MKTKENTRKEGELMKVLLTTLNSKYIHSSLSLMYLKSYIEDIVNDIETEEYTINQHNEYIIGEIFRKTPDVVAFSCYIWNIEKILEISHILKMVNPRIKIILGGPEVSFDSKKILMTHPYIDFIICGEGEETLKELLLYINEGKKDYRKILGLVYRDKGNVIENGPRPVIANLDNIPSPFKGDLSKFKDRIIYYESSRGCPFNCQFCLSSAIKGVRFFSIDRVKDDLDRIIKAGVRQVKFVDRTFNTRKEFALEVMKFIISRNVKDINFHFEITAHLMDDEMLEFLKGAPEGLFQFEIGVQSTNLKTLEVIDRRTNFDKLASVVKKIKSYQNIHQHLDLIAGLPFEDYDSFKKSFNDVYSLRPDKLQLGFLKLLKGSGLREKKEEFGFKFLDKPPYEVIENNYISFNDMLKLKGIEDLVEKYANEFNFEYSLEFIIKKLYNSPFDFFEAFSKYWIDNGLNKQSHSKNKLYSILYKFYVNQIGEYNNIFNELIKYDYILNNKDSNIPSVIKLYNDYDLKSLRHEFLKEEKNIERYLPQYKELPVKKIINNVHFEEFEFNIIDFIKNGYDIESISIDKAVILFAYNSERRVFNRCDTFDVTNEIKRLEG